MSGRIEAIVQRRKIQDLIAAVERLEAKTQALAELCLPPQLHKYYASNVERILRQKKAQRSAAAAARRAP